MSAPTKGSGTTWVGRSIRRLEDPALVRGQGHFTADLPAVHWLRFVRSPIASGRITRITVTARHKRVHRRRSSGREADQADAAQVQLHSGRATDPASGRRAVCRRADRRGRWPQQGGGRGYCRSGRGRACAADARDRRAAGARWPARRSCMPRRRPTSSSKAGSRRRISMRRGPRRTGGSSSKRCRAGRMRRRWRRAPAMPSTTRHRAASRSPAPRRCRI